MILSAALMVVGDESEADDPGEFVHETPQGVRFVVTDDGLSEIHHDGRSVAEGGLSAHNAGGWFKLPGAQVGAEGTEQKSLRVREPDLATVTHRRGDVTVKTEYHFDGEDVVIEARVINDHPTKPIRAVQLSGLDFHFDSPPSGYMPVQHISYFQHHGPGLAHPSHFQRVGGTFARDGTIGVGTSPWRTGLEKTMTLWDYGSWARDARERLPRRTLRYFVIDRVPAGGANTFRFKLRVSPDTDWRHLLAPYRTHFRRTFGEVRYEADHRWIATDYLNKTVEYITEDNPYGFHGGHRRIDTDEGVRSFIEKHISTLKEYSGQGVIVWGQSGSHPRGAMYRPDFHALPPEVRKRWPELVSAFNKEGLRFGVTTRPSDLAVTRDWDSDRVIALNPEDPTHLQMMWNRFKQIIDSGVRMFYLDSFGNTLRDVKIVRHLRKKMEEETEHNILMFAEHQVDAIMPFTGGYSETTLKKGEDGEKPYYRLWSGLRMWRFYRWLAPGSQMVSRLYRVQTDGFPEEIKSPAEFFYTHRITPLLSANDFGRAGETERVQERVLKNPNTWAE